MQIPGLGEVPDKRVYFAVGGAAAGYFFGPGFVAQNQSPWIHAAIGGAIGYALQPSVSP